jgi:ketosteroid isomerase-like protein
MRQAGFVRSETLHVDHDLAYESGYSEARFPHGLVLKGRFSTVWKRQGDGHWKIFRNISLPAAP